MASSSHRVQKGLRGAQLEEQPKSKTLEMLKSLSLLTVKLAHSHWLTEMREKNSRKKKFSRWEYLVGLYLLSVVYLENISNLSRPRLLMWFFFSFSSRRIWKKRKTFFKEKSRGNAEHRVKKGKFISWWAWNVENGKISDNDSHNIHSSSLTAMCRVDVVIVGGKRAKESFQFSFFSPSLSSAIISRMNKKEIWRIKKSFKHFPHITTQQIRLTQHGIYAVHNNVGKWEWNDSDLYESFRSFSHRECEMFCVIRLRLSSHVAQPQTFTWITWKCEGNIYHIYFYICTFIIKIPRNSEIYSFTPMS